MSWLACGGKSRKKNGNFGKIDLYKLKEKYRFTENELLEFKQRFSYLSNAQELLDKEVFRENMGLLGLDSGSFLADRIFAVLDSDKDGHIKLEEYLKYFDILIYGTEEEKYELTFKMIDLDSKGSFNFDEFEDMIRSMLYTWNSLTGSHYNIDQNRKLDQFLHNIFRSFDIEGQGKVTLQNFKDVVTKNPQLLEIFDTFNQGIIDSVQPTAELDQKDLVIIDELESLHSKLNQLKEYLGGKTEQFDTQKKSLKIDKTADFNKVEGISPRSEIKTPIVSSLDSKIKRTIFFEVFKEEMEHRGMKPARLRSEKVSMTPEHRLEALDYPDYMRRFSYQAGGGIFSNSHGFLKNDSKEGTGEVVPLEKFKSVGALHSRNDANTYASFHQSPPLLQSDKVIESAKKDLNVNVRDYAPGISLYQQTPRLRHELKKDENGKFFAFTHEGNPTAFTEKIQIESGLVTPKSLVEEIGLTSPDNRRPMLRPELVPIQPKWLDPELENPFMESIVLPPRISQKSPIMLESIIVTKPNCSIEPEMEKLKIFSPVETHRSGQGQAIQIQQVSEQLESLATETLRIIEEIRNKKKNTLLTPQQTAEIEEGQLKATAQNIPRAVPKERKGGSYVSFGHQNWNLVLNMMLGIQAAVKSVMQKPDNFTSKDFKVKYIFELVQKRTSSTKSSYKICTFLDYAPSVFYDLRRLYGIKNEDYLRSIGPENMLGNLIKGNLASLSELTSTGKSGSFFYFSADGKYTLKTISRDEFHFLRKILHSYYTHLISNPNSLMIKFFGLHKIRFIKKNRSKEKVYLIIMANVFHTFKEIHERYDLKGSTKGRITNTTDPSVAKKDLNIIMNKEKILLPADIADTFIDIIEKDSKFFEQNNIIDYSLLMGIHKLSPEEANTKDTLAHRRSLHESRIHSREGILSSDGTKLYFFGIIDILTEFNAKKKAEYVVKRMAYGKGISAVPPSQYADRFRTFIKSLVVKS